MINLIPEEAKKYVRREYWVRVISVWLFLLAAAIFIMNILLIPSLVLIYSQLQAVATESIAAYEQNNKYTQLTQQIRFANDTARQLLSSKDIQPLRDIIFEIENQANDTIGIKSIVLQRNEKQVVTQVQIVGMADSRQALVVFRNALEAQDIFESVDLPLANLAKDTDVPFNLTISLAVQQK